MTNQKEIVIQLHHRGTKLSTLHSRAWDDAKAAAREIGLHRIQRTGAETDARLVDGEWLQCFTATFLASELPKEMQSAVTVRDLAADDSAERSKKALREMNAARQAARARATAAGKEAESVLRRGNTRKNMFPVSSPHGGDSTGPGAQVWAAAAERANVHGYAAFKLVEEEDTREKISGEWLPRTTYWFQGVGSAEQFIGETRCVTDSE